MKSMKKPKGSLLEYLLVLIVIGAATGIFIPFRSHFAEGQWALIYLMIVVIVGSLSGFGTALLASVSAFLSWNYFLIPPYHTFIVNEPKNIIFLFVFLFVGIVVGFQTAKLRKLAQAKALHEADKLKSTLISSVSHELKTPLAAINATITNILSEEIEWDKEYVRSELDTVTDDIKRLGASINSLLDFSRLETESWRPQKQTYELNEIIGSLSANLPQRDRERLDVHIPDKFPSILVDFDQFLRLLQNLVENGLRYSERTSKVSVKAIERKNELLLTVEDLGPGIPEEEKKKVFGKFYRGISSVKGSIGTGLGLTIAAEIVKYHGGKIWIEDILPHGTRMVISIPRTEK